MFSKSLPFTLLKCWVVGLSLMPLFSRPSFITLLKYPLVGSTLLISYLFNRDHLMQLVSECRNYIIKRMILNLPASRNVNRQVSRGMKHLSLEPLATNSTMASERLALCRNGKNCFAFAIS